MDENKYREELIRLDIQRVKLEEKKLRIESSFFNRHFGVLVTSLVGLMGLLFSVVQFISSERTANATSVDTAVTSVLDRAQACFAQAARYTRDGTQANDKTQGEAYFRKGRDLGECAKYDTGERIRLCAIGVDAESDTSVHC